MSAFFSDWLFDTFVYTGLLIALVLAVRRPVSRYFGPQVAYALWALPLLRFFMPPVTLPASMAPAQPTVIAPSEPLMVFVSDPLAGIAPETIAASADLWTNLAGLAVSVWLVGAAVFLFLRQRNYRQMQRELLAEARPVGETGKVRLMETPAVSAPVAFGVRDKVVALPVGFMARHDLAARDMAIAHELAHHKGHDLLANILAQPVLALHWFNPIAWWGWKAMRIDQEAACDARVVAGKARTERAAYAEIIAGFAAGDDLQLAAAMACPVLGEKSIIHRLRSLTMSDISSRRRRIGIAAITTTALALPLTASITYAHPQAEDQLPAAAQAPELLLAPAAPIEPVVPVAPAAPPAPEAPVIISIDQSELDHPRTQPEIALPSEQSEQAAAHIQMRCRGGEMVVEREMADGHHAIMVCTSSVAAKAAESIRDARESVARNRDIRADMREEVLRNLDREIQRMERSQQASISLLIHQRKVSSQRSNAARAAANAASVSVAFRIVAPAPPSAPPAPTLRTQTIRLTTISHVHTTSETDCDEDIIDGDKNRDLFSRTA